MKLQQDINEEKKRVGSAIWNRSKIMPKPFCTAKRGKTSIRASFRQKITELYYKLNDAEEQVEFFGLQFQFKEEELKDEIDRTLGA